MSEIRFVDREAAERAVRHLWGPDIDAGPLIEESPEIFRSPAVRQAVARTGRAKVAVPRGLAITGESFPNGENPAPLAAVTVWRIAVLVGPHFLDYALQVRNADVANAIRRQVRALGR